MNDFSIGLNNSDFRTQLMTVKELIGLWEVHGPQAEQSFMRIPSKEQCSRYVEALLVGMPLQPIYVDNTDGGWTIIDGMDRIKAYSDFYMDSIPLSSLYFTMKKYGGYRFRDLSNLSKKNFLNAQIQVHVLNPGLSRSERFGVYVCLKSRIDSDTLHSCRKRIYKDEYGIIEDMANDVTKASRLSLRKKSYLENEICHLLVSCMFESLGDANAHMDVVANMIMESDYFKDLVNRQKERIIEALCKTRTGKVQKYGVFVQDLYNAVVFHLPEKNITEDSFFEAYRMTSVAGEAKENAADFCKRLNYIISFLANDR